MNMKQFRYVLVLADTGSFSRAAEELNISQPSLSQYIKKIETQLGVELFNRTNGNVRLTDAGKIYIDAGKKILDLENQMQQKFLELAQHKTGSITIGTTPFRSVTMMPSILAKFRDLYPGIHVIIDERETSALIEATEKGEFDLCVLTLPVEERNFAYQLIMEEELVIAVPRNSKLDVLLSKQAVEMNNRKYSAIDIRHINQEAFVMITEAQVMQRMLDSLCQEYELKLSKAAVVKSLEAQIEMVKSGVGAALVPIRVCNENDKIRYYSLIQELPRRKVVVMYRKNQYLSSVVKDLIEIMKVVIEENNV